MDRDEARELGLYAVAPLALLIGFGVTKVLIGLARGRPVGFPVVFLVVAAGAAAAASA